MHLVTFKTEVDGIEAERVLVSVDAMDYKCTQTVRNIRQLASGI